MAEYYVVRDMNTGLYFRGKGVNKWGKYYNQASIYRIRAHAENTVEEETRRGAKPEVVPIQIFENTADVEEVKYARWKGAGMGDYICSLCNKYNYEESNYCPHCGARMDGGKEE